MVHQASAYCSTEVIGVVGGRLGTPVHKVTSLVRSIASNLQLRRYLRAVGGEAGRFLRMHGDPLDLGHETVHALVTDDLQNSRICNELFHNCDAPARGSSWVLMEE